MVLMETVHSYYMCFPFIKIIDHDIISRSCPILAVPLVNLHLLLIRNSLIRNSIIRSLPIRSLPIHNIPLHHPVPLAQHALQVRVIHPF